MNKFDVTTCDVGASTYRIVHVQGEFGLPDVDDLQATVDRAAAEDAGVVVELEGCEFIDSMALASLVRAHNQFAEDGRRLVIGGTSSQVHRVLEISGLNREGLVYESVDQALLDR